LLLSKLFGVLKAGYQTQMVPSLADKAALVLLFSPTSLTAGVLDFSPYIRYAACIRAAITVYLVKMRASIVIQKFFRGYYWRARAFASAMHPIAVTNALYPGLYDWSGDWTDEMRALFSLWDRPWTLGNRPYMANRMMSFHSYMYNITSYKWMS